MGLDPLSPLCIPRNAASSSVSGTVPFALLSVNTDDEVATLRKSIRDGRDHLAPLLVGRGPGRPDRRPLGNLLKFPSLFLIDGDGVIREKSERRREDLDPTVERLVEEADAIGSWE